MRSQSKVMDPHFVATNRSVRPRLKCANCSNKTFRYLETELRVLPRDILEEHGNDIDGPYPNVRCMNRPCGRTAQFAAFRLPLLSDQKISEHRSREYPQDHHMMKTWVDP